MPAERLGHSKDMLQPLYRPVGLTECGIILMKHKNGSLFSGESRGEQQQQKGRKRNTRVREPSNGCHFLLRRFLRTKPDGAKHQVVKKSPACHFSARKRYFTLHVRTVASCCVISQAQTNLCPTHEHSHIHTVRFGLSRKTVRIT